MNVLTDIYLNTRERLVIIITTKNPDWGVPGPGHLTQLLSGALLTGPTPHHAFYDKSISLRTLKCTMEAWPCCAEGSLSLSNSHNVTSRPLPRWWFMFLGRGCLQEPYQSQAIGQASALRLSLLTGAASAGSTLKDLSAGLRVLSHSPRQGDRHGISKGFVPACIEPVLGLRQAVPFPVAFVTN